MTKERWRAWDRRWEILRAFELQETRSTTREEKFRQYLAVMRLADSLGLIEKGQSHAPGASHVLPG